MTSAESTATDLELPWGARTSRTSKRVTHLLLAWSLDEPERLGECFPIEGPTSLGRGTPLADDPAPRGAFVRSRPGQNTVCAPISNARISRVHLVMHPEGEAVRLRSVGRAPVRINGVVVTEGVARDGDVVELQNAALFYVCRRPKLLPVSAAGDAAPFAFAEADPFGLVGESEAAWGLREAYAFAGSTDRHVLLLGESGVGKELAARSIHGLSSRRDKPLIARNASTMPETLLDAELFGNAKSYPNAGMPERPGLIGEADGSTLFLDEIGDLPEKSQVHLLRVLDSEGEYQRLGESRSRRSSLKLVAATNRAPEMLKHDFLARFVHRIEIAGLGQRREDIPLVAAHLLRNVAMKNPTIAARFFERRSNRLAEARLMPGLVARLLRHPFTHHVRELERLLWLAIGTATGDVIDLTPEVEAELGAATEAATEISEVDRETLVRALEGNDRSPTRTAKALGLKNRYVLIRLLRKHGLSAAGADDKDDR